MFAELCTCLLSFREENILIYLYLGIPSERIAMADFKQGIVYHTINRAAFVYLFVCLSGCLFVPYLLRGPLTDLRQTWWVYVGGPRNCP